MTDADLESFAAEEGDLDAACKVVCGPFVGLLLTRLDGTRWWRFWFLRHGRVYLFVTYNASIELQARDHPICNEILGSLKPPAS